MIITHYTMKTHMLIFVVILSIMTKTIEGSTRRRRNIIKLYNPFNLECGYGKKTYITSRRRNFLKRCDDCPKNTYQPFNKNQPECILCDGGETSSTGQRICTGTKCAGGYYAPSQETQYCSTCPNGKFQDKIGQRRCKLCQSGTWNDQLGQSECKGTEHICPAGMWGEHGSITRSACKQCIAGKYTDASGLNKCYSCGKGQFQPKMGKTSCIKHSSCKINEYLVDYSSTSDGRCIYCLDRSEMHKISFWVNIGVIITIFLIYIHNYRCKARDSCIYVYNVIPLLFSSCFAGFIGNCSHHKNISEKIAFNYLITISVFSVPIIIFIVNSIYKEMAEYYRKNVPENKISATTNVGTV
jgi:hypothetical protein